MVSDPLVAGLAGSFFMPHGHCYLWNPLMVGLQVITNSAIGCAYVAISAMLATLIYQIRDLPFKIVYGAFGLFIVSCGITHFLDVWMIWQPFYWADATARVITATASVGTALMLPALLPRARALMAGARAAHRRGVALESAVADLEAMYQRSREVEQLKSDFVARVSHDLRTPCSLILASAQRLAEGARRDDERRADLALLGDHTSLLLARVEDLLDVAKLEAGGLRPRYHRFDLATLLRQGASHFCGLAEQRRVAYALEVPAAVEVELDSEQVSRVLLNLLANAFKFTPPGGSISCTLVEVDAGEVRLTVDDSGPGVAPERRAAIFEPFVQGGGAVGGTGLGLSIVRDFVRMQAGSLACESSPQGGARFVVRLPRRAPAGALAREAEAGAPGPAALPLPAAGELAARATATTVASDQVPPLEAVAGPGRATARADRPRIIVAEDNGALNQMICGALRQDFEVFGACDGQQALACILAQPPDLVISDLAMPGLSGEELLAAMRGEAASAEVPMLLLTAQADRAVRARLLAAGAQDYITKPFDVPELLARARNLVAVKRARAALALQVASQGASLEEMALQVRHQAEQIALALAEAEAAQAEASRHSADKSDFLHLIAHELNTPLTAMQLQVGALCRHAKRLDERGQRSCAQLLRTTRRLVELVASVTQYGRLVDQRAPLPAQARVSLEALAADVRRTWDQEAAAAGVKLVVSVRPADLAVASDGALLRTAVGNLVGNALKFTPAEGQVTLSCAGGAGGVAIDVGDTGSGIDEEDQKSIFTPFVFLEAPRHKHTPGLGLGLPLVRTIALALGGEVSVKSERGRGSTFTLWLPAGPGGAGL